MDKKEVAAILEEIAVLLELKEENPFKVRAYRTGARAVLNLDENLADIVKKGTLDEYEGIGESLAEKITKLVKTGRLPYYEKLKRSTPEGVLVLMQVPGLGAKKINTIYKKLKIKTIAGLKKACEKGQIATLPRFGEKTQKNILDTIAHLEGYQKRHLWWEAMQIAAPILESLRALKGVKKAEIAGSLRRRLETIGDLDIVVAAAAPKSIMRWFTSQPFVERVLAKGETKASIRLKEGMQADLRIVPESQFGYALLYFTGSKEHNIKIRERAKKRGWLLSEYELKGPKLPKNPTETDIYKALGMPYIPPEIRENLGEIEAALKNKLPTLVEEKDIRGTFHNHTTASDGRSTLKEMVAKAQELGWEYIGISDHSKSSFQANGMSEERLFAEIEQIRALNRSKKFRPYVFAGVECDILANGSLDFKDDVLKELDYVVVSVHNSLQQDEKTMTKRIIRAIENPYATMLGHLTGRLLLRREPYKVNIQKVIDACIANETIIELNASPLRLDMDWRLWHAASEKGLLCCINTDAHSADHLEFLSIGIGIARKGWLEKQQIFNTRPLKQVQKYMKHALN